MNRSKVSKTERLLNLISFMLRSPRPIPFSQIAGHVVGYDDEARLDSIEKRFDRDKAELRNMGIPVEYVDGGSPETSGYVIPKDRFFLGPLELDSSDAILLALAGRSATIAYASPIMREALRSALRKLAIDTPEVDLPAEPASILQVSSGHQRVTENLQIICAALFGRRRIRFDYAGRHDQKPARRKVDPYGLGVLRGEWYLVAYCHAREDKRMFKLSRIRGTVALTGASDAGHEFEIPGGFRIGDHLKSEAWEFGGGTPTAVRVRVPPDLARQLTHQSTLRCEAEQETATGVVLRFDVPEPARMLDWIVSLGPDVELLEPPELIEEARRQLDAMAVRYREEGQGAGS